jgi:enoyl-CoA hydratase/carnithine racemase
VEGYALAGGCELVLACDLVVAARDSSFGLPEVRRGLIADSGGLLRLPRRVPQAIAIEYALTGDPLPAVEAHRWGLVNRLTDPGAALAAARELAGRISRNGPLAVRTTKRVLVESPYWPFLAAHVVVERGAVHVQGVR